MEQTLRIDEEFKTVLPPLSDEEFQQLEENILREGIINPIITWDGIIVDGHNRYAVAQKHPEVTFVTKEMKFSNRYEVIDWIITHQRGQRNLTDAQWTDLVGLLKEVRSLSHGGNRGNQYTKSGNSQILRVGKQESRRHSSPTSEQIGKEFGIAARTVDDAYAFHKGIEAIKAEDPETANDILTGKLSVTKKEVIDIRKAEPEELKKKINDIKEGTNKPKPKQKTRVPKESEAIKEIKRDIEQSRTITTYTPKVDDLLNDIKNNAIPFIRLFNQLVDGYKDVIKGNSESVLLAIKENIEDEINKLKEKITNEYA